MAPNPNSPQATTRIVPAAEARRLLREVASGSGEVATAVASLRARRLGGRVLQARGGAPADAWVPADRTQPGEHPWAQVPPPEAVRPPPAPPVADPQERTRVDPGRAQRRPPEPEGERESTRKIDRRRPWSAEGVALLAVALHKAPAVELLALLAEEQRGPATAHANHLLSLDSSGRKARLARDFGERNDASVRLRAVFAALPSLATELWHCLPEHHRRSYPELAAPTRAVEAPRLPLLERLVKEALR